MQLDDPTAILDLEEDEDFEGPEYTTLDDEIYIGGIYVRLFLNNPNYKIRRPETFIEALLQAHEQLAPVVGMAKDLGYICTCIITVLKVRVTLCDHVANLGYVERLLDRKILTQAHGKKAMLKYMHLLAKSPVACEKFVRGGGASVCFDLMQQEAQRKDVMFVLRKMLQGSMPSVRTELTTQMEEQGYITAIFEILKNKGDPVPLKVAAVEVIKAMQDDEDEATSEAVKASVERYPEWREFKDARHDLFVQEGEELLLLEGGNAETLLLEDAGS